jgi:hypothetical protein
VPDDLLEFVSGPPSYSTVWLWLGLGLLLLVLLWYATVFVATMPSRSLRSAPALQSLHGRLLRHRYAKTAGDVTRRYRDGDLTAVQAGAALSHTLRSFLYQATGAPAQYMQLRTLAASDLAAAAPVLDALGAAQFDRSATVDVGELGDRTAELIRSWS